MLYLFPSIAGGLIAGTLDILYAVLLAYFARKMHPVQLLQFISSGLLGKGAYEKGIAAAISGFLLHYLMAFVMAFLFVIFAKQVPALTFHFALSGALYGVIIYIVMMYIVIPFSRTYPKSRPKGLTAKVGDGWYQAAFWVSSFISSPSLNMTPVITFGN